MIFLSLIFCVTAPCAKTRRISPTDRRRRFAINASLSRYAVGQFDATACIVRRMAAEQKDCRIPSSLVPKCPVCGREMEVNIRKDEYFVQDKAWYAAEERCEDFCDKACGKRTLLLELGVCYNTPTVIRFPFERMVYENENVFLVRVNAQYPDAIPENAKRTLSFAEDIGSVADGLGEVGQSMQGSGNV